MTKYELLKSASTLLRLVAKNNIKPADADYIALYDDYVRMKAEGQKYEFIVYYLSDQYGVSETTVWRIVKRMEQPIVF